MSEQTDPKRMDMALPEGRTCGDCVNFQWCSGFVGATDKWTSCDWSPSRFHFTPVKELAEIKHALKLSYQTEWNPSERKITLHYATDEAYLRAQAATMRVIGEKKGRA